MINLISVHIENFQSHKNTTVEFGNFVGIVGPTNQGKTAIIRAIIWCLYNTPNGADFIRHGEEFARVTVKFSNNKTVIHEKGSKNHVYVLREPGKEDVVLEHFGAGPVDLVMQFHGMRIVSFNDSEKTLNVCQQLEPPFFIAESAPSKAAIIGRLAGTDIVDTAIKNSAKDLRAANQTKILEEQLKTDRQTLESYKDVDEALSDLASGQKIADFIQRESAKIEAIRRISEQISACSGKIAEYDQILAKECDIGPAIELVERTKNLLHANMAITANYKVSFGCSKSFRISRKVIQKENTRDFERVEQLLSTTKDKIAFKRSLQEVDRLYSSYVQHNVLEKFAERGANADEEIQSAQDLASKIAKLVLTAKRISSLFGEIEALTRDLESITEKIALLEAQQQDYFKEIGFCPTCQRPFRTRKG